MNEAYMEWARIFFYIIFAFKPLTILNSVTSRYDEVFKFVTHKARDAVIATSEAENPIGPSSYVNPLGCTVLGGMIWIPPRRV